MTDDFNIHSFHVRLGHLVHRYRIKQYNSNLRVFGMDCGIKVECNATAAIPDMLTCITCLASVGPPASFNILMVGGGGGGGGQAGQAGSSIFGGQGGNGGHGGVLVIAIGGGGGGGGGVATGTVIRQGGNGGGGNWITSTTSNKGGTGGGGTGKA